MDFIDVIFDTIDFKGGLLIAAKTTKFNVDGMTFIASQLFFVTNYDPRISKIFRYVNVLGGFYGHFKTAP